MLYAVSKFIFLVVLKLFFGLKVYGREKLPYRGGVILASNHASYLDPIILGAASPRPLNFMAREDLFRNWLFGRLISNVNAFPIERKTADPSAVKEATKRLRDGKVLTVFPEGTRSIDGSIGPGQLGVGLIANKSQVPVIPVFIKGSNEAFPKGAKFLKCKPIQVYFGPSISFEKYKRSKDRKPKYDLFVQDLMEKISLLKQQAEVKGAKE